MICDFCRESNASNRAEWILIEEDGEIKMLCSHHLDEYIHLFGEVNTTFFELDFETTPSFRRLVNELNNKIRWYKDIIERLRWKEKEKNINKEWQVEYGKEDITTK